MSRYLFEQLFSTVSIDNMPKHMLSNESYLEFFGFFPLILNVLVIGNKEFQLLRTKYFRLCHSDTIITWCTWHPGKFVLTVRVDKTR